LFGKSLRHPRHFQLVKLIQYGLLRHNLSPLMG
jgi:hypothetical protein